METDELLEDGSMLSNVAITNRKFKKKHQSIRQLRGDRRNQVLDMLECRKPASVRRKVMGENMQEGDPAPAIIPPNSVLRKAKEEGINKILGIKKGQTFWESMQDLKTKSQTAKYMRDGGAMNNMVVYHSQSQIGLYNAIQKSFGHCIAIDATAGISQRVKRNEELGPTPFLFTIVTRVGKCIVPVAQLLSEMQDANTITWWLNGLIQSSNFKIPRAAVTDRSKAMENALSMAFNWMSFKNFNEECLRILMGGKTSQDIPCRIRNDIAHLIKSVGDWDCFKNKPHLRGFYLRIIGFMTTLKNFADFQEVTRAVFLVATSEFNTTD